MDSGFVCLCVCFGVRSVGFGDAVRRIVVVELEPQTRNTIQTRSIVCACQITTTTMRWSQLSTYRSTHDRSLQLMASQHRPKRIHYTKRSYLKRQRFASIQVKSSAPNNKQTRTHKKTRFLLRHQFNSNILTLSLVYVYPAKRLAQALEKLPPVR